MGGFDLYELGDPPATLPSGLLETHVQTQQKLEVMLRYWEVWCLIIAQATGHAFCVHCMWLVDGFAGAGLHATIASGEHGDGRTDQCQGRCRLLPAGLQHSSSPR